MIFAFVFCFLLLLYVCVRFLLWQCYMHHQAYSVYMQCYIDCSSSMTANIST